MHDRSEWSRGSEGVQVIKGKTYHNLVEFTRPCMTCAKPFSIFVTRKIADGGANSHSFGLKNCEEHRRNKTVNGVPSAVQMANDVMREELQTLYTRDREQFARIQVLEATLASHGVPSPEPAQNTLTFPWQTS